MTQAHCWGSAAIMPAAAQDRYTGQGDQSDQGLIFSGQVMQPWNPYKSASEYGMNRDRGFNQPPSLGLLRTQPLRLTLGR